MRSGGRELEELSGRIAGLLERVRETSTDDVWESVDALMRALLELYGEGLRRIASIVSPEVLARDELLHGLLSLHGLVDDAPAASEPPPPAVIPIAAVRSRRSARP